MEAQSPTQVKFSKCDIDFYNVELCGGAPRITTGPARHAP
jgi:hypothetical protein